MSLFRFKTTTKVEIEKKITQHQKATQKTVEKAQLANNKLVNVFEENGFTIKIALAMGAKQTRRIH